MGEVRQQIQQVDDDYLAGLSNKGIVKRAYKDLNQEQPAAVWQEEEVQVTLREETCVIRAPLGKSSCSCPSRSICRHVVTAILWLQKELGKEEVSLDCKKTAETENLDGNVNDIEKSDETENKEAESDEKADKTGKADAKTNETEKTDEQPGIFEELLTIPLEHLKRICKGSRLKRFVAHMEAGDVVQTETRSVVTVQFPWENTVVKLLEPLEYSSCTCRSAELCVHKAQALLAFQIHRSRILLEDLEEIPAEDGPVHEEQMKKAGEMVRKEVADQLCTGLSRQSPEAKETMERLAVICHRAGLADFEGQLREIGSLYQQYFNRSAVFRGEELLGKLLSLYEQANRVTRAKDKKELRTLAGVFRESYQLVGRLQLMSIGRRFFFSKTGYEGDIYYFLETKQKQWYTWTDVRPVFYEGVRKRQSAAVEKSPAPWGLPCNREQLMEMEFLLKGAKAAGDGRLSVSQETKGDVLGVRRFEPEVIGDLVYWDYGKLLQDMFGCERGTRQTDRRKERLALVGAVGWEQTKFDEINQRFFWSILDEMGRKLFISLKNTKEDGAVIKLLERLAERLKKNPHPSMVFFGSVYLEDGQLRLYPIEIFQKETAGLYLAWLESHNSQKSGSHEKSRSGGQSGADEDFKDRQEGTSEITRQCVPDFILKSMEQYQNEAAGMLEDLFSAGLFSLGEEMLLALSHLAKDGESMGLHQAGEEFAFIRQQLEEKKHQVDFSPEGILDSMGRLHRYLQACQEKISYDRAYGAMKEEINKPEEENGGEEEGDGEGTRE